MIIGVISDTHGLMRPQALKALSGCGLILHAGDIGRPEIIQALQELAPVLAVRGNMDREAWNLAYPRTQVIEVGSQLLYMIHNIEDLDLNPNAAGFRAVIYGHSHQAAIQRRNQVLFFNPGSAGPRRFKLPVTIGKLHIQDQDVEAEIIPLDI